MTDSYQAWELGLEQYNMSRHITSRHVRPTVGQTDSRTDRDRQADRIHGYTPMYSVS